MRGDRAIRIVFMGTPSFAVPVLSALLVASHDIVGVYTQPDRPKGRGRQLAIPPVKQYAAESRLPLFQPTSLRLQQVQNELASLSPDLIVVVAYRLFLPPRTLQLPSLSCLNVHPSLLPSYRGPSPVASAILNGDTVTGVTIAKITEAMDAGPIVAQRETAIGAHENTKQLTAQLFQMGADLLVETLPAWAQGQIDARPQDESQATVTRRLSKEDGEIDWKLSAARIARQVLAFHPWPGSSTRWKGKLLKVIEVSVAEPGAGPSSPPGLVVPLRDGGVGVVTGEGTLAISRLQLEGRKSGGN